MAELEMHLLRTVSPGEYFIDLNIPCRESRSFGETVCWWVFDNETYSWTRVPPKPLELVE